jgi:hypothetical protein
MAKDNRTLKLSILADIDDLKKKLKDADNAVEQNSNKIGEFSAKVGKAFLVAGAAAAAYAGKLLYDGVKAAIEDEKANAKLATTLLNVAGATQQTIDEVLAYSRATELATGVTEDELRPSLNRLAIATKDASEAMRLQQIALDVAAGSGKGLDAVTQALAKAYEGNTASLGRLGIGLSAAELKTMSFDQITRALSETFAGQADVAANTFEGRIQRLRLAFEDVRDSLAEKFLPFLEQFINFLFERGIPALDGFVAGLTGDEGLSNALTETQRGAETFGKAIAAVGGIISGFITFVREAIGLLVEFANQAIRLINIIKPGTDIGYIPNPSGLTGKSGGFLSNTPSVPKISGGTYTTGQGVTNITVNAIDSESAARAVTKALNESAARSNPYLSRAAVKK